MCYHVKCVEQERMIYFITSVGIFCSKILFEWGDQMSIIQLHAADTFHQISRTKD